MENVFIKQLIHRIEGDRQAMDKTLEVFLAMLDRKMWKQMNALQDFPMDLDALEAYLMDQNIFFRQIELIEGWWNCCTGKILAFMTEDDTPVVLMPRFSSYTFLNPKTGKVVKIDRETDLLKKEAFTLCYPIPGDRLTLKDMVHYVIDRLSFSDAFYSLMASLGVILLTTFTPFACKMIFAEVIPSGDIRAIVPIATLLFSAAVGMTMVQIARNLVVVRIKDKAEYALQTAMMSRLLLMPTTFLKGYAPGDLSNRVLSISRISSNMTEQFLSTILTFIFSGIMFIQFFTYGGPLLLTGVAVITLMVVTILLQYYYVSKVQQNVNPCVSHLLGTLSSFFSGIQKIKTCGAEIRAFYRWAKAYEPSDLNSSRQPQASFVLPAISYNFRLLPMIVTMWAAWHYNLGLSDYVAYCGVLAIVCDAVLQLQAITKDVARLLPEIRLCQPIMEEKPEVQDKTVLVKNITGAVEIHGLEFRYADEMPLLFNGLDLVINPGDYVALVGPSGCGKSTLIRLMLGFERIQGGSIFYDQYNLQEINQRTFRQFCVSICLQDGRLIKGTILDNILFNVWWKSEEDAWEAARLAALDNDIRQLPLGMQTPITPDGRGVSGGQRQRILIARALIRDPRILFLDEATSALDNISQQIVIENLAKLSCTRIVIAHRMSTIRQCNRIVFIEHGRVVEDGTFDDLVARGGRFSEYIKQQTT